MHVRNHGDFVFGLLLLPQFIAAVALNDADADDDDDDDDATKQRAKS